MPRPPHSPSLPTPGGMASKASSSSPPPVTTPPAPADEPWTGDRATAVEAVRALVRTARVLERAAGDLGLPMYRVLSSIGAGEDRASRVAERFSLGRPAVSAAVEALCRDGLVRRTEVAGDQRAIELSLTPLGKATLEQVDRQLVGALVEVCSRADRPPAGTLHTLAALGPAVDDLVATRRRRRADAREQRHRPPGRR